MTILTFFSFKFNKITKEINKLRIEHPTIDNKKLSKLINDYNCVYLEIIKLNDYFKYLIGFNFFNYFTICIVATFLAFNADNLIKTVLGFLLVVTYFMNLFFPFKLSQIISTKVSFFKIFAF